MSVNEKPNYKNKKAAKSNEIPIHRHNNIHIYINIYANKLVNDVFGSIYYTRVPTSIHLKTERKIKKKKSHVKRIKRHSLGIIFNALKKAAELQFRQHEIFVVIAHYFFIILSLIKWDLYLLDPTECDFFFIKTHNFV